MTHIQIIGFNVCVYLYIQLYIQIMVSINSSWAALLPHGALSPSSLVHSLPAGGLFFYPLSCEPQSGPAHKALQRVNPACFDVCSWTSVMTVDNGQRDPERLPKKGMLWETWETLALASESRSGELHKKCNFNDQWHFFLMRSFRAQCIYDACAYFVNVTDYTW